MLKFCDQCEAILIEGVNCRHLLKAKRCTNLIEPHKRSECQVKENRRTTMISNKDRYIRKRKPENYQNENINPDGAWRTCLRCEPNEDGSYRKFWSKGKYLRICGPCSRAEEALSMKNISRVGGKTEGVKFINSIK